MKCKWVAECVGTEPIHAEQPICQPTTCAWPLYHLHKSLLPEYAVPLRHEEFKGMFTIHR